MAAIVIYGLSSPMYIHTSMEISEEQLQELTEVIEDTVEYFCDKEQASGEKAWTVINCLSFAKLAEIHGKVTAV